MTSQRIDAVAWILLCFVWTSALAAGPEISAGYDHSVALKADGSVQSWGANQFGQLGDARPLSSASPLVVAGISDVVQVAGGRGFSLALRRDGTVWSWGTGYLGNGASESRTTPGRIRGLENVVAIAADSDNAVALTTDGSVWIWGWLPYTGGAHSIPVRVPGLSAVRAIATGGYSVAVLKSDGTVWAWGSNMSGQLGDGTTVDRPAPVQVSGLSGVTAISMGFGHALALRNDGTVWSWGRNDYGQLGDGTRVPRTVPARVESLPSIRAICAGGVDSFAVQDDGSVWFWGAGPLDGLTPGRMTPGRIAGITAVVGLASGDGHVLALKNDRTVWVWGTNSYGQLGDGTRTNRSTPTQVPGLANVTAIAATPSNSMAVGADGRAYAWGDNTGGQLGDGAPVLRTTPVQAVGLDQVAAISAGDSFTVALKTDGTVWSWGFGGFGKLGTGTQASRSAPAPIAGLSGAIAVSAGAVHAAALLSDGTARAWGRNDYGQLGDGTTSGYGPVQVAGLTGVTAISAGGALGGGGFTLALRNDGTVWAWGVNLDGQLGDGTFTSRPTPRPVNGLANVIAISAGGRHSLALRNDGTVWAWGRNDRGQLGDGAPVFPGRSLPVQVAGLSDVVGIAASQGEDLRGYSMAVRRDGTLWAWGANEFLFAPPGPDRTAAEKIPGLASIVAVSAGETHVVVRRSDGSVLSWGSNRRGELGDGTLAFRPAPIVVRREGGVGALETNDWFLDLDPAVSADVPTDARPPFLLTATGEPQNLQATVHFRSQDIGSIGSVFVFALAPQSRVVGGQSVDAMKVGFARDGKKADAPVPCVLAQLNSAGQMTAVTSANLSAYLSGVLSSQGASVSILNNVPASNVAGATFFVGYGANASTMINSGVNRAAVTVPGSLACEPARPQTGWWWNPQEDGRGYSVEVRGNNIFFASFLYDISGRSTWYVSTGPVSLEGSYYSGPLLNATGGQTLGGGYPGRPAISSLGNMTLTFHNASSGTLVWPGGTVPIQRFNIIPNGLNLPAVAGQPESGWWWNPDEDGRGFFMEWQNGTLDIAGYMYDDSGNPVWYLTVGAIGGTSTARSFSGNWWSYGNGMTLYGPWRQHQQTSNNVAPLTITFTSPTTALMTLPNGRTTSLRRHTF